MCNKCVIASYNIRIGKYEQLQEKVRRVRIKSSKSLNYEMLRLFRGAMSRKTNYMSSFRSLDTFPLNLKIFGSFWRELTCFSHESVMRLQQEHGSHGRWFWSDDLLVFVSFLELFELSTKHVLYIPLKRRFGRTWVI